MAPPRVVIDPNVWVSSVISPTGVAAEIARAVAERRVIAIASPHLLDELAGVLARDKFRRWITTEAASQLVADLGRDCELLSDTPAPPQRVRDPHDDYLAALASSSDAVIVTGDADLLEADLKPPAITPRQLLQLIA